MVVITKVDTLFLLSIIFFSRKFHLCWENTDFSKHEQGDGHSRFTARTQRCEPLTRFQQIMSIMPNKRDDLDLHIANSPSDIEYRNQGCTMFTCTWLLFSIVTMSSWYATLATKVAHIENNCLGRWLNANLNGQFVTAIWRNETFTYDLDLPLKLPSGTNFWFKVIRNSTRCQDVKSNFINTNSDFLLTSNVPQNSKSLLNFSNINEFGSLTSPWNLNYIVLCL